MDPAHSVPQARADNDGDQTLRAEIAWTLLRDAAHLQPEGGLREQSCAHALTSDPHSRQRPDGLNQEASRGEAAPRGASLPRQGSRREGEGYDRRLQESQWLDSTPKLPPVEELPP